MQYQTYYLCFLGVFATVAYMMYTDSNVAAFIVLLCKEALVNLQRLVFWLKLYPQKQYDAFVVRQRYKVILRQRKKPPQEGKVALDPTTPWYEWNSYLECCSSLGVTPSVSRFIRYNNYYRDVTND